MKVIATAKIIAASTRFLDPFDTFTVSFMAAPCVVTDGHTSSPRWNTRSVRASGRALGRRCRLPAGGELALHVVGEGPALPHGGAHAVRAGREARALVAAGARFGLGVVVVEVVRRPS